MAASSAGGGVEQEVGGAWASGDDSAVSTTSVDVSP